MASPLALEPAAVTAGISETFQVAGNTVSGVLTFADSDSLTEFSKEQPECLIPLTEAAAKGDTVVARGHTFKVVGRTELLSLGMQRLTLSR